MQRKIRSILPAAVIVAGGLFIVGCGGGGGGGGGGAPPPGGGGQTPAPPNQKPVFNGSVSVNPTTVNSGDTVTLTWSASDPDNQPSPLSATVFFNGSVVSGSATSPFNLTAPTNSGSSDQQYSGRVIVTDGPDTVEESFTVTVRGTGSPPPPAGPTIGQINTYGLDVLTRTSRQFVQINVNYSGFDLKQVTITVDGVAGKIVRGIGSVIIEVMLPRIDTPGMKTLALNFPGRAPSTKQIEYKDADTTWAVFNYEDGTVNGQGRAVRVSLDSQGVMSNVDDLMSGNGHVNMMFAPGATSEEFWVVGQEASGEIPVFYINARTKTVNVRTLSQMFSVPVTGVVESIAPLNRDPTKAVIAWRDVMNSRGSGAVWWITVVKNDLTDQGSLPLLTIPTTQAMTPVQVIDHMYSTSAHQDFAVFGNLSSPSIVIAALETDVDPGTPEWDVIRHNLVTVPQVVEIFRDIHQQTLWIMAIGQSGNGVKLQDIRLGALLNDPPGNAVTVSGSNLDVVGAFCDRDPVTTHLKVAVACYNDSAYTMRDLTANTVEIISLPGLTRIHHAVRAPGNAWFAITSADGSGSRLDIVENFSTFTSPKILTSISRTNGVVAGGRHIFWETRNSDNIIVDELVGTSVPQLKPEPSAFAPGDYSKVALSRHLCR